MRLEKGGHGRVHGAVSGKRGHGERVEGSTWALSSRAVVPDSENRWAQASGAGCQAKARHRPAHGEPGPTIASLMENKVGPAGADAGGPPEDFRITAGGGGCACQSGDGSGSGGPLGLALGLRLRRRRR